jgi:uncharacterized protein (DUF1778 family)
MQATAATTTINVRATQEVRDLIDRAADLQGKTRTDFILEASRAAAQQVLLDRTFFSVSEAAMQRFDEILALPIESNAAVRRLLASESPWER